MFLCQTYSTIKISAVGVWAFWIFLSSAESVTVFFPEPLGDPAEKVKDLNNYCKTTPTLTMAYTSLCAVTLLVNMFEQQKEESLNKCP